MDGEMEIQCMAWDIKSRSRSPRSKNKLPEALEDSARYYVAT
jgi:hypothetical protein